MFHKHPSHKILFIVITLITSASLSGCSLLDGFKKSDAPAVDTTETMEKDTSSDTDDKMTGDDAIMEADESATQATSMTIDMSSFKFSPNLIEAKPGETITLELTNSQGFHDFVLDELDVQSKQISAGQITTVTIVVPADGTPGTEYEFYCSVGNHRAQGMVGTFRII